jgi:hypothetical protein
MSDVT